MVMDCSDVGLNLVPDLIPHGVVDINLRGNNISQLHNDSFFDCINVRKLDLSYNREISVIWNIMLRCMPELETIELIGNRLSYDELSFPDNTFDGLPHLKSVSIQSNVIVYLEPFPDEFAFMVNKLPQTLEELHVEFPGDQESFQKLLKFKKLRKLGIYDEYKPLMMAITNDSFKHFKNIPLEELVIRAMNLDNVATLAFYPLTGLKTLDISEISMNINDFVQALIGLQNTKLEKLKLSKLPFLKTSRRLILKASFCQNLVLPRLTDLQMDHAQLFDIEHSNQKYQLFFEIGELEKVEFII